MLGFLENKKLLKKIMWIVALIYLLCGMAFIIYHLIDAAGNGEALFDNAMYNFRTFSLGLLSVDTNYNFLIMDPIGFFAIPLIIFFALFFYLTFDFKVQGTVTDDLKNHEYPSFSSKNIIINVLLLLLSIILTIIKVRIPLCIHLGLGVSAILYFVKCILTKKQK